MNFQKENLNILIVLEAILETRSVSKASEKLGISQPSMSYMLARMREAFGDPMFIRVKNEMQPTPRALSIAQPVKQALEIMRNEIFHEPFFNPATSTQTFTLCMTDVAELSVMPKIVNAVRRDAPNVRLRTISPVSEKLEKGLESGAVDLAVGYFPDVDDPNVFMQRLVRSKGFVCIASSDNPHVPKEGLSLSAFSRAPHVAVRTEGRSQEVIEQTMKELGILRDVILTIPHFLGLLSIVPQTELISVVAVALAPAFQHQEGIKVHPLPFDTPRVDVSQIWHRRYHKDPANQWLRELVHNSHMKADL